MYLVVAEAREDALVNPHILIEQGRSLRRKQGQSVVTRTTGGIEAYEYWQEVS